MGLWGWLTGKQLVWGESAVTEPAPVKPEMVIIEFVCMEPGCKFETLSLTDASEHIQMNWAPVARRGHVAATHNVEPRGYYYKKEPL